MMLMPLKSESMVRLVGSLLYEWTIEKVGSTSRYHFGNEDPNLSLKSLLGFHDFMHAKFKTYA